MVKISWIKGSVVDGVPHMISLQVINTRILTIISAYLTFSSAKLMGRCFQSRERD